MIGNAQPVSPAQEQWRNKFPAIATGILSFLQLVLIIVIVGCEVGSMLIDIVTATIYVGIWASFFFVIAFISQATSSTCSRNQGCATYTLVIQCISLVFAACLIGFDSYYLVYPDTCFFSTEICESSAPIRGVFYTPNNFINIKIPLIKGQLAAGAVMFVLCLIFIIIYIITAIRVDKAKVTPSGFRQTSYSLPTGPDGMITAPPGGNIRPLRTASPLYHRPTVGLDNGEGRTNDLVCPTCSTTMAVSVRKRPPQ